MQYMVLIPVNIGKTPWWVPAHIERENKEDPESLFNGGDHAHTFETRKEAQKWIRKAKAYWTKRGGNDRGQWLIIKLTPASER